MIYIIEVIAAIVLFITFYQEIRKLYRKHQSKKRLFDVMMKMAKADKNEYKFENDEYVYTEDEYSVKVKNVDEKIRIVLKNDYFQYLDKVVLDVEVKNANIGIKRGWIRMASPLYYKLTEEFALEMEKKFK